MSSIINRNAYETCPFFHFPDSMSLLLTPKPARLCCWVRVQVKVFEKGVWVRSGSRIRVLQCQKSHWEDQLTGAMQCVESLRPSASQTYRQPFVVQCAGLHFGSPVYQPTNQGSTGLRRGMWSLPTERRRRKYFRSGLERHQTRGRSA